MINCKKISNEYNNLWFGGLSNIAKGVSKNYNIPGKESDDLHMEIYYYGFDKYLVADKKTREQIGKDIYFRTLAINYLKDQYRKYKKCKDMEVSLVNDEGQDIDISDSSSVEAEIIMREEKRIFEEVKLQLKDDELTLINRIIENKALKDIADELGCTVNNLSVRKIRIINKLKKIINEMEKENKKKTVKEITKAGVAATFDGGVSKGIYDSVFKGVSNEQFICEVLGSVINYFTEKPKTGVLYLIWDLLEN